LSVPRARTAYCNRPRSDSRRPGDTLSFGDVATALLKGAKCSVVFISPQARAAAKSSAKGPQAAAAAV